MIFFVLAICFVWPFGAGSIELRPGTTFSIAGKTATIQRIENFSCVQSGYTKRFNFDSAQNPKLKELREKYHLDSVVSAGTNEFQQQVLLNDWTHRQFRKFGHPSSGARGALQVLDGIQHGDAFFCVQYAEVMVSAAASLGWNDRLLALRRPQAVSARGGSTEHTTTEIWSNQYGKWIMLDPTSNLYLERDGTPLNAWEIRQEWFYRGGTNLTFVIGKERTRYRKKDLPISLAHFGGFGDLTVEPDELDKYGFIGYIPNTNLMDAGNDYGQMFIVKDQLCAGTQWHERILPKHPESEPYFPINQSAMAMSVSGNGIEVNLKTFTPNFRTFESRRDGEDWRATDANFHWKLHHGANVLESRAVNQFGVSGPASRVEISVH